MRTFRLIAVSTVLLIAYHNGPVKCDGEEGWTNTNNQADGVAQDHSTETYHNDEEGKNENQAASEHSNTGVSPPQDNWSNGEQESSGMVNTITEPSNAPGWSENPSQTDSQASSKEQHQTESTFSDSHDVEHQHATPSGQWSSEETTADDAHGGNNSYNSHDNRSTDSGISGATPSTDSHDEQGDHGKTQGWGMDTTPGGDYHWNNTDDPHSHSSTESSNSQVTTSIDDHDDHSHGFTSHDVTTPNASSESIELSGAVTSSNGATELPDSGTASPPKPSYIERSTESDSSGTTLDDGWRQDDSETHSTSNDHNSKNVESRTPEYSGVTTTSGWTNDHHMTSGDDHSWKNDDQEPTTSSYDGISDSPPHYDDPQYDGQSPPPDYDQVTLGNDYGEIPEEEPDKEGNELVAACRKESNYQGDFQDPNESSTELKCFYACAMVKMDVMNEESGQMQLNMQTTVNMIEDAFGDNTDMIEKYKNAVSTCDQEVQRSSDRCEYAFSFINCGIQKVQHN